MGEVVVPSPTILGVYSSMPLWSFTPSYVVDHLLLFYEIFIFYELNLLTRSRSEVEGSRIPLLDSLCSDTILACFQIGRAPVSHDLQNRVNLSFY